MQHAAQKLDALSVAYEVKVVSAHRTPDKLFAYAEQAEGRGLRAIIAGPVVQRTFQVCWRLRRWFQCWGCQCSPGL